MERRKVLCGIQSSQYEHEFDKRALEALKKTPGLDFFIKKVFELGIERLYRINYTGSHIRVDKINFPDLYAVFEHACEILDIKNIPDFYLEMNPIINGFTTGIDHPIVVLTNGAIDSLSESELLYIIGHELGHIKSGHVLYHTMARVLPIIGSIIGTATFGLGDLVAQGITLALLAWVRNSELTADRAGLLVVQESNPVIATLMKISGVPKRYYGVVTINQFIEQAKAFESFDVNTLDKVAKAICIMDATHPWSVMRASEILKWVETGEAKRILEAF